MSPASSLFEIAPRTRRMIFPERVFWHFGDNHDTAWTSDRHYLTDHRVFYSLADVPAGGKPRLQRYVEIRDLAFDFVLGTAASAISSTSRLADSISLVP